MRLANKFVLILIGLIAVFLFQNFDVAPSPIPGTHADGISDDAAAITAAIVAANGACIDGGGYTYAVNGNISVSKIDVCLKNMNFKQIISDMDYRQFVFSDALEPRKLSRGEVLVHDEDLVLTDDQDKAMMRRSNLRTLFVAGNGTNRVTLKNIRINKGLYPSLGAGGNAAAVYLTDLGRIEVNNLDITGKGEGFGLIVSKSKNVSLDNIKVHDIYWEPKIGGRRDFKVQIQKFGWNSGSMYAYHGSIKKFVEKRYDESASGILLQSSSNIKLSNSLIARILVNVDGKPIPWQADGITVSTCSNLSIVHTEADSTWEGIDMSGNGNVGIYMQDFYSHDNFAYGIKIAHENRHHLIRDSRVERNGMHGITVGAKIDEKVADITFYNTKVLNTGYLRLQNGENLVNPWGKGEIDAVYVKGYENNLPMNPEHIRFINTVISNANAPINIDFGLHEIEKATYIHNAEYNTKVVSPNQAASNFKVRKRNLYTFGDAENAFSEIIGCKGELKTLVRLWDLSHPSANPTPWDLPELRNQLTVNKSTYLKSCIP
jgi:hypothetical protein